MCADLVHHPDIDAQEQETVRSRTAQDAELRRRLAGTLVVRVSNSAVATVRDEREIDDSLVCDGAGHDAIVVFHYFTGAKLRPDRFPCFAIACGEENTRGWRVKAMAQAALSRGGTSSAHFRVEMDERVGRRSAFAGPKWVRGHAGRLVDRNEDGIMPNHPKCACRVANQLISFVIIVTFDECTWRWHVALASASAVHADASVFAEASRVCPTATEVVSNQSVEARHRFAGRRGK